jgi:hypothetical protein
VVLNLIITHFLYALPLAEKSYEFHEPIQYYSKITKDVFIGKLKEISHITEENDEILIAFRMLSIKNSVGEVNMAYATYDDHSEMMKGSEHIQFYFYVQFIENDNIILLKRCYVIFDERYSKEPEQYEIIDVFNQNVINYLDDKPIIFTVHSIPYQNYFELDRISAITLGRYELWPEGPVGPRRHVENMPFYEYMPFYRGIEGYTLDPTDDISMKIIKEILKFNWVLDRIDFPPEYHWYRFPKTEIKILYIIREGEVNNYPNYYIFPGGLVHFRIYIWKNKESYYAQIPLDYYFYAIDIEILKDIIKGTSLKIE